MILDTSAILAILFEESGYQKLLRKVLDTEHKGVSAPTLLETCMVLARRHGNSAPGRLQGWVLEAEVTAIAFGEAHWRAAGHAFLRYGKGRHPAGLNFGDCLSYATAKLSDLPLLFVGDDFSKTDIRAA